MQKLKGLREHYVQVDIDKWVPKKAYNSIAEIKKDVGCKLKRMHFYRCGFCSKLHTASYQSIHAKANTS